jgi:hypothetical protein
VFPDAYRDLSTGFPQQSCTNAEAPYSPRLGGEQVLQQKQGANATSTADTLISLLTRGVRVEL